jgi:hypothetical protein
MKVKRLPHVNDSPGMLDILIDLLQARFTIVETLSSGWLAPAETANLNPDIILDVDLGDMTGLLVAEKVEGRWGAIPAYSFFRLMRASTLFKPLRIWEQPVTSSNRKSPAAS